MWCPVVAPRKPPQAPCSSQEATQPAVSETGPSTPQPAKRSKRTKAKQAADPTQPTQPTTGKGKAAKAKPAPQPGRWLDRDCNAALNMQRIRESRWRSLELCYWPEQEKLPALLWHSCVPPYVELLPAYNQRMFFVPTLHNSPRSQAIV
ncbi:hypothetical protein QJQ45_001456 [Haematococcus lacustris]|nr:hypothetical protein QJQ45_001456 [Haematococcus lacustris]